MKLLIYGVTGFLGGNIACHFKDKMNVHGVAKRASIEKFSKLQGMDYHPFDFDKNSEILRQIKPNIIIFCISLDHNQSNISYSATVDKNIRIYAKVLEDLKSTGLQNTKVIYLSTAQTLLNGDIFSRVSDCKNMYGLTHLACEKFSDISPDLNIVNLRIPNVIGVPKSPFANIWWNILPSLIKSALLENKMEIKSDGAPTRVFIDVSDFCLAVGEIISKDFAKTSRNLNIIPPHEFSISEFAQIIRNITSEYLSQDVFMKVPSDFSWDARVKSSRYENFIEETGYIGSPNSYTPLKKTILDLIQEISKN